MTHMTHQDGGDQQRRLRVGEEVEETVQVELFADLGVAVVPRHEVDQGEATHQGDPLELPTRFFCVSTSQTLHLFPCSPINYSAAGIRTRASQRVASLRETFERTELLRPRPVCQQGLN